MTERDIEDDGMVSEYWTGMDREPQTCPLCHGEVYGDIDNECPRCHGEGVVEK